MVESVACYGCEVWLLKRDEKRKLLALEMGYLRSQPVSRLKKKKSITVIRSKMQAEQSILNRTERRQLKWYGQPLRMDESRSPKKIYQWKIHGKRRGRRKNHGKSYGRRLISLVFGNE